MQPSETIAPRILTKPQAASYCGLTVSGFEDWVRKKKLPGAMKGTRRWDKTAIDLSLDRLSGVGGFNSAPSAKPSALAAWMEKKNAQEHSRR